MLNAMQVFCLISTKDEDAIRIYNHNRVCEIPQDIIHHPHECCWSIIQAKSHDQPLKKACFRLEGSLPYISLFNRDLVVS
jgi:hypothetical protein